VILLPLFTTACMIHDSPEPLLTGPAEFGLSLNMAAMPDLIARDGLSQSTIVVTAFNPDGAPVPGVQLRLDMIVNGVYQDVGLLGSKNLVTDGNGRATTTYTAPPSSVAVNFIRIEVSPVGTNQQNTGSSAFGQSQSVDIRLVAPNTNTFGAPVASFSFSPTSGITTTTLVAFNAGASYAVTGTSISNYAWDWGDGTVDNVNGSPTEDHDWAAGGTYSVTLTVTDNLGMKSSTTQFITVG
jgi:PKD repeat protein